MVKSNLTGKELGGAIYRSLKNRSITSLSKITEHPTIVYIDKEIAHLQTNEMESIETYYDKEYEFYNQSEEDDILYKVIGDKKIFRQQHQVETILSKLDIKAGMKILDYGCAKGTVMKRMLEKRNDIKTYLFDISKMYENLWRKFVPEEQFTSYQIKPKWHDQMDVVTSFFAFEHVVDPVKELLAIKKLLKVGGLTYIIVPNVFENYGDFIVADHVHHYSEISLRYILTKAGFEVVDIDPDSHFGAFIAIGKKTEEDALTYEPNPLELSKTNKDFQTIANYWNGLQTKIILFESTNKGEKAAIYGGGVYGNFIGTNLKQLDYVLCFIDQNVLLYSETILGKAVYPPTDLPEDVTLVYVGVNPKIARDVISSIESWKNRKIKFMFL